MSFPLPLNYFSPLRLSKEEETSFLQWGDSLLQQTIDAYHREQCTTQEAREQKWKPIKQKRHLTVYKRRKIRSDKEYKYMCTGRIEGTLDEVVMGRYADNTPDFRRISGVYREDLVDCAVLGVIKARSSDDPFFLSCFKWMTVASPGKGLVKNRDVCWYEQIGITRDRNGKEIGYTLTESVELPTCPPFRGCVRAKLSVCYLYKRNKSGGVKVYMRGKNEAGGAVVDWVTDIKSAELWLRIDRAKAVAHAVLATALVNAGSSASSPPVRDGTCQICLAKASSLLSAAKECAVCHRLTCATCVSKLRVLSVQDFRVPRHEDFCTRCTRLMTHVDLRNIPETVQHLVQYVGSSLPELETISAASSSVSKSDDGLRTEGEFATSISSSRASIHEFRQPLIRMQSSPSPSTSTNQLKPPLVMNEVESETHRKRHLPSTDKPRAWRRTLSYAASTEQEEGGSERPSETPFLTAQRGLRASRLDPPDDKRGTVHSCRRTASTSSADSIMNRIIEMNLAAEQSLHEIETNLARARQLSLNRA